MLGEGIGRDLTIRFSRQSKYLSRSTTILNAQLLANLFVFFFPRADRGETHCNLLFPLHIEVGCHTVLLRVRRSGEKVAELVLQVSVLHSGPFK